MNVKRILIHALLFVVILFLNSCAGALQHPLEATPTRAPTISLPDTPPTQAASPLPVGSQVIPTPDANPFIWIANPVDQAVLQINTTSNTIQDVVPVDGEPSEVVAGEGAVWALDKKNRQVFRIDPQRAQVVTSIALPAGDAEALAVGAGSVWVGMTGKIDLTDLLPGQTGDIQPPSSVIRIHPATNAIMGELPVQPISRIEVEGSALWVLSRTTIDTPLQVFDLNSGQGMAVPLRNGPEWLPAEAMAVDPDSLWLFSAAYAKIFHATTNGLILAEVPFRENRPTGYADLLLLPDGLWAATPWGTILHIDPRTNHLLGQIELGIPLSKLIAGQDAVWAFSQQAGLLFRIDPRQNVILTQISTGSPVTPTVVPTPTSRIVIWKPCPDAPTSRLKVGVIAYVTKDPPLPNRIREEPNREAETLGLIGPGGSMDVIDGPACSDGWVWWKVKNAEYEGWTAEGDMEDYWLIPLFQ